jgi:hypothetical protein
MASTSFCINAEEVEMEMRDWQDDWKIPVITKDMPKGKEVEAGSSKTSAGGSTTTKKSNTTREAQSKDNATEEGKCSKEGCTDRKERQCPNTGRTRKGGHNDVGNPINNHSTRDRATQAPIIHTGGPRKKAKAHKKILEYTITEDDVDLVAERVQDHTVRSLKRPRTKEEG